MRFEVFMPIRICYSRDTRSRTGQCFAGMGPAHQSESSKSHRVCESASKGPIDTRCSSQSKGSVRLFGLHKVEPYPDNSIPVHPAGAR